MSRESRVVLGIDNLGSFTSTDTREAAVTHGQRHRRGLGAPRHTLTLRQPVPLGWVPSPYVPALLIPSRTFVVGGHLERTGAFTAYSGTALLRVFRIFCISILLILFLP